MNQSQTIGCSVRCTSYNGMSSVFEKYDCIRTLYVVQRLVLHTRYRCSRANSLKPRAVFGEASTETD